MLFHTIEFFWFMVAVLAVTFALPRAATVWVLLVASYVFYGWSGPAFTLLLLASSLVDYTLARSFAGRPRYRRLGITLSALLNFSLLGFFKYANFAVANINPALVAAGLPADLPFLHIILPVGISFYTFQSFAYTVDVLMDRIPPCRSLVRYMLFVSWFPQLVAGPIMRAGTLVPQIERIEYGLHGMAARVPAAAALFAEGWLRKACADLVAPASDAFFAAPGAVTSAGAVFGTLAFGLQIYGDFSGYTKMAQGASWLYGVRLMENFNLPYAAASVREFWRRWHISLSTWFRDYLYIPLGGNRSGPVRNYFNLAFTMLVCGLWHGASWTFVAWGALHGAALILERLLGGIGRWIPRPAAHALTLLFVFLAWIPFRAPDLATAWQAYCALANGGWTPPTLGWVAGAVGLVCVDLYFKAVGRRDFERTNLVAGPAPSDWRAASLVAACALAWMIGQVLGQGRAVSFIYFQF